MEKSVEEALKYALETLKIEDMELTEEEQDIVMEYLKRNASDDSFLYGLVEELKGKKDDKNRK